MVALNCASHVKVWQRQYGHPFIHFYADRRLAILIAPPLYFSGQHLLEQVPVALLLIFIAVTH